MIETTAKPTKTKAAVLQKQMQVRLEERPIPPLGPRDVLVKIMAVGVCGSDVHYYEHGRIGSRVVEYPIILGHECSGVVFDIGHEVTGVQIGERVAIEPGVSCFHCEYCKAGQYNLCPSARFLSSTPVNGAFTQFIIHPEHLLHPIPDHLTFENSTLVEPLSVGIHACKRAGIKPGSTVFISGLGPIGLTAIIAAKEFGAKQIIVSDIEPYRLHVAEQLGATQCINAKVKTVTKEVLRVTKGKGVNVVFDTSGQPKVLDESLSFINRGGKIVPIGFPVIEKVPLNITLMIMKEIDLCAIYRYTNTYPLGIEILASGKYKINPLITNRYDLEETETALEQARTNKKTCVKVIVFPNGTDQ
jgi:L-iditol 2-dehydrogenase